MKTVTLAEVAVLLYYNMKFDAFQRNENFLLTPPPKLW